jgi:hypothetical protein
MKTLLRRSPSRHALPQLTLMKRLEEAVAAYRAALEEWRASACPSNGR